MENSRKFWYIVLAIIVAVAVGAVIYKNFTPTNPTDMKKTSSDDSVTNEEQKAPKAAVKYTFPGVLPADRIANKMVTIKTKKGDITFEMFDQEAPKTVSNFVYLAEQNYYDNLTFHRVVANFVIQGGDPTGNGTGGPGYKFADEKVVRSYDQGIVAMANSGPNTNGSQFFIMLDNVPLPKLYTIFGKVTSGMDVVKKIQVGDVMESVTVSSKK
ncbi:MAG: peptidylprolyl isomerase [Candidatus Peregrinibacteria bacterium]|nr:peptidylprolyl isomerase [Candidatus Peregrinibacteria bacterium]